MPAKIRKKSERGGLKQPDQVMTRLQVFYGYLDKFKYHIVAVFVGIVVLLLASSWWVGWRERVQRERAESFYAAFQNLEAPVRETAPRDSDAPVFKTREEKFSKAADELKKFIDDNSSAEIAQTARLALASAKMEVGDYEGAYNLLSTLAEDPPCEALIPLIHENLGLASLELGKVDEAVEHFLRMKDTTADPFLKARALMHVGDAYNPASSVAVEKDASRAKELYEEALSLLPEEMGLQEAVSDPAVAVIRQELELRLSLLKAG